jgi:Domain of unknown function DUF29
LDVVSDAYENARDLAMGETDLPEETFPKICCYSLTEILDNCFYPGAGSDLVIEVE